MAEADLSKLRIERGASTGATRPGRRRRRAAWAVLAVLGFAAAAFLLKWNTPLAVETASVVSAYPSQAHTLLNATGYVVAQRKAAVASKATGRLEWLGVREGSRVAAGEVLARLENRDVSAQLDQATAGVRLAQANLEQAEADRQEAERAFRRSRELLEKKFVSPAAHDTAVARHERAVAAISAQKAAISVAQANVRAAQVAVEQTLIRAPFDGVVLTKNANVGDVITPFSSATGSQAAVVTMADMSTLEVEADVAEGNLSRVRLEQPCEIQLDALPDRRFRGVVHRLVPTVDRAKATVTAKIRFIDGDPRVLPEMSAKVSFLARELAADARRPRTAVPAAAVARRNGKDIVFAIRDGKASVVVVRLGERMGDLIEVVEGVTPGERIALKPPAALRDGAMVTLPGAK